MNIIAERLRARHLILQYNLVMCCMYVSVMLWNTIITVGISVTSLMITSAMCTYYYTQYMYVHVLSSYAHVLRMERRKELARLRK